MLNRFWMLRTTAVDFGKVPPGVSCRWTLTRNTNRTFCATTEKCLESNPSRSELWCTTPPHVGPQGRDKSVKRFDTDFGATMPCGKEQNWTLSYLYPPFLEQAKRVLKPEGLLLAKITDMVNCHRSKWPHVDFFNMAEQAGFTVCDLIVKVRTGPMKSTKWKRAYHARKRHCFWIVCRNGDRCE